VYRTRSKVRPWELGKIQKCLKDKGKNGFFVAEMVISTNTGGFLEKKNWGGVRGGTGSTKGGRKVTVWKKDESRGG